MRSPSRTTPFLLTLILPLIVGVGCTAPTPTGLDAPTGPPWFQDVTDQSGLDFVHDPGPAGTYFMPQTVGSGCALFDADGDGLLDLYFLQNAGPKSKSVNRLFLQQAGGKFRDATTESGLGVAGHGMGAAVGDVNNDGRPDLLVTQFGGVRLFLNDGGGKFRDVTEKCGLSNPLWGASAAFFDYDRDGWLDLFIANYVDYDPSWPCTSPSGVRDFCAPRVFPGTASKLFHNLGAESAGRREGPGVGFEDVTLKSNVGKSPAPGLGVVCADFDGDGWQDVFVANDGKPNHLWMNKHDGTFAEEAVSRGAAYTAMGQAYAGMGIAQGDIDNDGLLDLYVTHLTAETNTLWKQGPRGLFQDRSGDWGLLGTRWRGTGFGTLLADFDHDGRIDLAVVNGRVQRGGPARDSGLPEFWETYAERNQVFANTGSGFHDVSADSPDLCGGFNVGRGLVSGDIDGDGAPDLVVTCVAGKARLLRNVAPDRGHWLRVRAFDPRLDRDALGAEVTVVAGGVSRVRLVTSADSYLCAGPAEPHFGLGSAAAFSAVRVAWPDGTREEFAGGQADRLVVVRKGEGRPL